MLSGETVVGGVELKEATLDEASVAAPEKLDSEDRAARSAIVTSGAVRTEAMAFVCEEL